MLVVAEAEAIRVKGQAFVHVANSMAHNLVAAKLFQNGQQTVWFSSSSHILFNMSQEGMNPGAPHLRSLRAISFVFY